MARKLRSTGKKEADKGAKGAASKAAGPKKSTGKIRPTADEPAPQSVSDTRAFYLEDYPKTLFPLETNRVLLEHGEAEIKAYIAKCLDEKELGYSFSQQRRVFVSKPDGYLRRTVKLDVIAEYYLYDVVFRNRALFRKPHAENRTHYGYRFTKGTPIAATQAYKGFKGGLAAYGKQYAHSRSMDVATYFNSLYQHDIVSWFHDRNAPAKDTAGLGQLLREIAGGRSVDCLPQGLYPTKMIGNDFLRFVEEFHDLKSDQIIRFMDDIVLFADDKRAIDDDFQMIQRLIGDRGLSLNSRKTRVDDHANVSIDSAIDDVKRKLLRRRRIEITVGYDEEGTEIVKKAIVKAPLTSTEMAYIEGILEKPDIEEEGCRAAADDHARPR
jgi:hypothetical protein